VMAGERQEPGPAVAALQSEYSPHYYAGVICAFPTT
jgi:hypothetical protein